jgi:hypothetical protein
MTTATLTAITSDFTAVDFDDCLHPEWSYQEEVVGDVTGDDGYICDYNEIYAFCYYNPQGTSNIEEF